MDEQSDDSSDSSSSSPSPSKNDANNNHERQLHQQDLGAIDEDCSISSCFEQWWLGPEEPQVVTSSSSEGEVVLSQIEFDQDNENDNDDDDDLWNFLRDQLLSED